MAGTTFTTSDLMLNYISASNEFDFSGSLSTTVASSTPIALTLGSASGPGLKIIGGKLKTLNATLSTSSSFNLAGVTIGGSSGSSLSLSYQAAEAAMPQTESRQQHRQPRRDSRSAARPPSPSPARRCR